MGVNMTKKDIEQKNFITVIDNLEFMDTVIQVEQLFINRI